MLDFDVYNECVTDQPTDQPTNQPTDRPTDTAYYRDARTHLKMKANEEERGSDEQIQEEKKEKRM